MDVSAGQDGSLDAHFIFVRPKLFAASTLRLLDNRDAKAVLQCWRVQPTSNFLISKPLSILNDPVENLPPGRAIPGSGVAGGHH